MPTQLERIASLETLVSDLKDDVASINNKMDDLLALRNKGAGVLWVLSGVFAAGVALLGFFSDWFKG